MSDLTATNCGCNDAQNANFFGNNGSCNLIWLILLLSLLNNNNDGCGCGGGFGLFNNSGRNSNNSCSWLIWILLISCFCGNN